LRRRGRARTPSRGGSEGEDSYFEVLESSRRPAHHPGVRARARQGELIWSSRSQTHNPRSIRSLAQGLAPQVVEALVAEGLLAQAPVPGRFPPGVRDGRVR